MNPRAYYNEIDPNAVAWLRALIAAGHIAPGDVDTRSIVEVTASDLEGYTQCHFFAGIGVWSYALRQAGWPDSRRVWTGSCPCQPFSVAGRKGGVDDARHLWPYWFTLIAECQPSVVFGEQVASPDGLHWLDAVSSDLEAADYALGAADLCAAGVGAPHIRQRLYFVGHALGARLEGHGRDGDDSGESGWQRTVAGRPAAAPGAVGDVADATDLRHERGRAGETRGGSVEPQRPCVARGMADATSEGTARIAGEEARTRGEGGAQPDSGRAVCGVALTSGLGRERREGAANGSQHDGPDAGWQQGHDGALGADETSDGSGGPGPTNGIWRDADWLLCRDGKWRPVEPGTFPLAHGAPARVGRLRGYGNAIVAPLAQAFIEAAQGSLT